MKRFGLVKTVCGLSALLVFSPLFADSDLSDKFNQLDVNGDGYISSGEAADQSELLRQWANVDQNADGQIEMSEFSAFEGLSESDYNDFNEVIPDPGD